MSPWSISIDNVKSINNRYCKWCEKQIKPGSGHSMYCSDKCATLAWKEQQKEWRRIKYQPKELKEIICPCGCKKKFKQKVTHQKYASQKCQQKASDKRRREREKANK